MKLLYVLLLAVWVWGTENATTNPSVSSRLIEDPASFVLPFIGTTNGGHVFPGATLPNGMIKVGMDTDSPGNHAGYDADPRWYATGFSQLHDSGTGGVRPFLVPIVLFAFYASSRAYHSRTSSSGQSLTARHLKHVEPLRGHGGYREKFFRIASYSLPNAGYLAADPSIDTPDDFASPGYFSSNLSNDIRVELTAARRAALHRYTFPSNSTIPRVIVGIDDGQHSAWNQVLTIDSKTARVRGGATFWASFGPGEYRAFTCTDFKGEGFDLGAPAEFGLWQYNTPIKGATDLKDVYDGFDSEVGALFGFDKASGGPTTVLARVGVSFISSEQACRNAEEDIPDFDFDRVHRDNRAQWNDLLGRIQVDTTGVSEDIVQLFYSSVYRSYISPADYSGENPRWNSSEPYYDSYYCNWDTYRTLYPLMALQDPVRFSKIVRAMIDIQKHEGWLPECRGATVQQWIQGGSNADPILGEFWVKYHEQATELGVSGDDLYNALLADAEIQAPNWDLQGRQANPWKTFNYIPHDNIDYDGTNTRQVSRTLEYAFDDFAISQVAKIRGNVQDAAKYAKRAGNYLNVWNPNTTVPGTPSVRGMMQPRLSNGTFDYTDPRHCSIHDPQHATCYLDGNNHDGFYEGSPMIYSQYVPHDTARLLELQGGVQSFIDRLDFIFEQGYFESTNEPSQQMPFMYHYANRPGLSTQRSRQVIARDFNTTILVSSVSIRVTYDVDLFLLGAMGSYAAFYLAGLYPLPATKQILLSSPYFPSISFFNPLFNSTTIGGQQILRLDRFPVVAKGCYELRIWVRKRSCLFRKVAVDFVQAV
ncbi:glycoside hydrolase family 92 protein [Marasmius fiardii PR-910]|nr:glycoside hydrolase family 92 protein [Marasmius fiardii PR-910]